MRKILRHTRVSDSAFSEDSADDIGKAGPLKPFLPQLLLVTAEREHLAMRGLLLGSICLQIAHDDVAASTISEIDEGVRHEHAGGIEHVSVVLTFSQHQQSF